MKLSGEKISYASGIFFKTLLMLLLSFFLLQNGFTNGFLFRSGTPRGWFFPIFGIYIVVIACAILFYWGVLKLERDVYAYIAVFILALILRLIIFSVFLQEPVSDFYNYYKFGFNIKNRQTQEIAMIIADYQMPKMGGLALFNGILCYIFSDTMAGQQLAHVVLSTLICPAMFLAFKRIGKKPALLATLLYAIYPSSLVSAQYTTNNHGAALFFLISIYFFIEALNCPHTVKTLVLTAVSGVFLVISDFIHASAIILLIAMLIVTAFSILRGKGVRIKNTCAAALLVAIFFSLSSFGLWFLNSIYVIDDTRSITPLFKIVMGFNEHHRGFYSGDYDYIKAVPFEEQNRVCLNMLKDRLIKLSAADFGALISEKTGVAWFDHDLFFYFFDLGETEILNDPEAVDKLSEDELYEAHRRVDFTNGMRLLDALFLHTVYLLSIAGIIMQLLKKENEIILLSALVPLGWMLFIMISEVQSRYRFSAMPFYMLLAAAGVFSIKNALVSRKADSLPSSDSNIML